MQKIQIKMKLTLEDIERLDEIPDSKEWLTNGITYMKHNAGDMERLLFVARFQRGEKGTIVRLVEMPGSFLIYWTCRGKGGPWDPALAILRPLPSVPRQTEAEKKSRAAEFGRAWRERKRMEGMCARCGKRRKRAGLQTCGC